jgi:hypothetical protein
VPPLVWAFAIDRSACRCFERDNVISRTRICPDAMVLASPRLRGTLARPCTKPGDAGMPLTTVSVCVSRNGGALSLLIAAMARDDMVLARRQVTVT